MKCNIQKKQTVTYIINKLKSMGFKEEILVNVYQSIILIICICRISSISSISKKNSEKIINNREDTPRPESPNKSGKRKQKVSIQHQRISIRNKKNKQISKSLPTISITNETRRLQEQIHKPKTGRHNHKRIPS